MIEAQVLAILREYQSDLTVQDHSSLSAYTGPFLLSYRPTGWPVTNGYCSAFARALGVPLYFTWKQGVLVDWHTLIMSTDQMRGGGNWSPTSGPRRASCHAHGTARPK